MKHVKIHLTTKNLLIILVMAIIGFVVTTAMLQVFGDGDL